MSNESGKVSYIGTSAAQDFLDHLSLQDNHRADLLNRKIGEDTIKSLDYKTIDPRLREFEVAWDKIKSSGVPYIGKNDPAPRLIGMAIPVRDLSGQITSIVLRRGEGQHKYIFWKTKNGRAQALTHVPLGTQKEDCPTVMVTEGVLKADLVHRLTDYAVLGMHGLNPPKDLVQTLTTMGCLKVLLAIDNEEKIITRRARVKLIKLLEKEGFEVCPVKWKGGHKGIDDAIIAGSTIEEWSKEEVETEFAALAMDLIYVSAADAFFYESRIATEAWSEKIIKRTHAFTDKDIREMTESGEIQVVTEVKYKPDLPKGIYGKWPENFFNTYEPPRTTAYTPSQRRAVLCPLIRHLKYLVPEKSQREIVLKWAASIIQQPHIRHRWMLMLFSEAQQIGKGLIAQAFKKAVGKHNWAVLSNDGLMDPRGTWLVFSKLIAHVEELYHADSYKVVNRLKDRITEPELLYERKYVNAWTGDNTAHWLGMTNEVDGLKIDRRDERFCFIQCAEEKADKTHYKQVGEAVANVHCASILRDALMRVDLEGYNPQGTAPKTDLKDEFITASRSSGEEWAAAVAEGEAWPGILYDAWTIQDMAEAIENQQEGIPHEVKGAKRSTLIKWLKSAGLYVTLNYKPNVYDPPAEPGGEWLKRQRRRDIVSKQPFLPETLALIYEPAGEGSPDGALSSQPKLLTF